MLKRQTRHRFGASASAVTASQSHRAITFIITRTSKENTVIVRD